jgi:hypothetical protein
VNKIKKSKSFKWWKNKLDEAMSKLVREKNVCEKCGNVYAKFHDAHVVGRRNLTLRWCILNHLCLDAQCHRFWWHEEPLEAATWFQKKFPERYQYLMANKDKIIKRTESDYKEILEAIENKDFKKLIV